MKRQEELDVLSRSAIYTFRKSQEGKEQDMNNHLLTTENRSFTNFILEATKFECRLELYSS